MVIRPLDIPALKSSFRSAKPFPFFCIDGFLEPDFAAEVSRAYPSFQEAERMGKGFMRVNERLKVQVTDYDLFPSPVQRLADALSSSEFIGALTEITGIPKLRWDTTYTGGGMHQTASTGLLDVHVDFNYLKKQQIYRRLNILLYLNPAWNEQWGGQLELWDKDVKVCHHTLSPVINRCVVFETSDFSYHGVRQVKCPDDVARRSFAAYYYTAEPSPHFAGSEHSTVFRARPDEHLKKHVLMPAIAARKFVEDRVQDAKREIKKRLLS